MTLTGVLQLLVWLLLIPAVVGTVIYNPYKGCGRILFMWVCGQTILWSVFFVICIPFIITQRPFSRVVSFYGIMTAVLVVISAALFWGKRGKNNFPVQLRLVKDHSAKNRFKTEKIFLILFLFLLALQLFLAVYLAYYDGDDAYYVAVSELAQSSDTMYYKNVYSSGFFALDYRRALAPFPIWIAFLSRISGVRPVVTAHVAVSADLILMANSILFLLGGKLYKDNKKYIFMFLAQLLILWGDYSMYTPERFLIARSRQGKAAFCAIVLPLIFLFLLLFSDFVKNKKKIPLTFWGWFLCLQVSGLLCSEQAAFLGSLITVILGGCSAVAYRKWKLAIPFLLSCMPAFIVFLIYYVKTR